MRSVFPFNLFVLPCPHCSVATVCKWSGPLNPSLSASNASPPTPSCARTCPLHEPSCGAGIRTSPSSPGRSPSAPSSAPSCSHNTCGGCHSKPGTHAPKGEIVRQQGRPPLQPWASKPSKPKSPGDPAVSPRRSDLSSVRTSGKWRAPRRRPKPWHELGGSHRSLLSPLGCLS